MGKKKKKLILDTETLRELTGSGELRAINGGAHGNRDSRGCDFTNGVDCPSHPKHCLTHHACFHHTKFCGGA